MKIFFLTTAFIVTIIVSGFAQMGIGTTSPNPSSVLDLSSTNKAFLPPRMNTTQRKAISATAGMMVYNTDSTCIEMYNGSAWINLCNIATPLFSGSVVAYSPAAVTKSASQKVYAHYLPWFSTPSTNSSNIGSWGEHWTMSNQNPNTINNGYRQIASYYYPLTGPYASIDTTIIDYQLLLMKLSGIDGVIIDWPGTGTDNGTELDLPQNLAAANMLISRIGQTGLTYAIMYEDGDLNAYPNLSAQESQAHTDMLYAQTHYFSDPNYTKISGQPLLLDFGPIQLTTSSDWTSVFTSISPLPAFYPLEYDGGDASGYTQGEFAWPAQTNISNLTNFYNSGYNPGSKITVGYQGFNPFYARGGESGPTWTIASNGTSTFTQTLSLAFNQGSHYMQLATWNDYGEGTMIEPTDSTTGFSATQGGSTPGFGFSLLTALQQQLGVSGLSQTDLAAVLKLYTLRQTNSNNPTELSKLDQVYYYMVSLQMTKAEALLATL